MIDSGRRFFPLSTVTNLLDTMLAVKLNVLHLHASDECRWSVESKLFPNLTASLSGVRGGFYTQEDIGTMIAYAQARGIRVVPEFDIPSHSRGLRPIKSEGVVFCSDAESQSQVYGDPANSTLNVLTSLFTEMAGLFPDEVFHIGADETSALGPCTVESTFSLERTVLNYLETNLNKTAAGWEEVLFDAGAATNKTIVYAWSRHYPNEIINAGRRSVDSMSSDFYMTSPAAPYPGGWKSFWYDISTGVTSSNLPSLLGGEMSMW
jgi:hexosaminidase